MANALMSHHLAAANAARTSGDAAAALMLMNALPSHSAHTSVDVSDNGIGAVGVGCIAEALAVLSADDDNDQAYNGEEDAPASASRNASHISALSVAGNPLGDAGLIELALYLPRMRRLAHLDIGRCTHSVSSLSASELASVGENVPSGSASASASSSSSSSSSSSLSLSSASSSAGLVALLNALAGDAIDAGGAVVAAPVHASQVWCPARRHV